MTEAASDTTADTTAEFASDTTSESSAPLPDGVLPPPLKWAGGKRWLLSRLAPIFERCGGRRLVEPFAGGMATTLGLNPERALVNDINPHLINFYRQVQQGLVPTMSCENEREFFFARREEFNRLIREGRAESREAAELFYYLNRTCFNGLCRFNSKGEYNVPFGQYKTIPYRRDFSAYQKRFAAWRFSCVDFSELQIEADDFLYVDPPYDVEFTKYSREDFSWKDQERLVEWLTRQTVPMVVSNQATYRILDLYTSAGFTIEKIPGPRRISCTGERDWALEIVAVRNLG